MSVTYTYDAHIQRESFNPDWSEVTLRYSFSPVTLTFPLGMTEFTVPEWGMFDPDVIGTVQLGYLGRTVFLTGEHPVEVVSLRHGSGLSTALLTVNVHVRDPEDNLIGFHNVYIRISGDPLPEIADADAFETWMQGTSGWGNAPTAPVAPGTIVAWASFALMREIFGTDGPDRLVGTDGNDTIHGGDGADTIIGGGGDDLIFGGRTEADVRDVIYGGDGNDTAYGGAGNDEIRGDAGNDLLFGETGADTLIGGTGNDTLNGGSLGDVLFGGDGDDFLNGGFGFDRLNGGAGADTFFHLGVVDHGSDWIQDYNAAEGDVLQFGQPGATRAQFQINIANTPNAGAADVAEAFVIYRPTGQIIWALVDGAGQDSINIQLGGTVFDLLA
jgi:serralysin